MLPGHPGVELYCLVAPERAELLDAVAAHYAQEDPRVQVIVDRRGTGAEGPAEDERRPGTDRRRQVVPRRLVPLPPELAELAGDVRYIQRLQPVATGLESAEIDGVVAAFHSGDPAAAPELYWRYYERIHSRMTVLLGDPEEAHSGVARAFGAVLDALEGADAARFGVEELVVREVDRCAREMTNRGAAPVALAHGTLAVVDPALEEPVAIGEYDDRWARRARTERDRVLRALAVHVVSVEHIGGTAVEGLASRPVIDLVAGLEQAPAGPVLIESLEDIGYSYRGDGGTAGRQYLRFAAPDVRVDLHLVEHACPLWEEAIMLRDYLRRRPGETAVWSATKKNAAQGAEGSGLRYIEMRREHLDELVQRAHSARGEFAQRAV